MGYFFVACTLATGLIKGYCGKKSSGLITTYRGSMLFCLVRLTICVLVGSALVAVNGCIPYLGALNTPTVIFAMLAGIGQAGMIVTWLISARLGSLMLLEVFNLLGIVLTVTLCFVCFGEPVSVWQIVAMLLLLVAAYVMVGYSQSVKGKMTLAAFVCLLIGALMTGLSTFAQKGLKFFNPDATQQTLDQYSLVFNVYTYAAAALVLIVAYAVTAKSPKKGEAKTDEHSPVKQVFRPRPLIYVTVMATCLFAYSLFQTLAGTGDRLDAAQIYPLTQGGGMLLTMLMAAILFGERINARCLVGILLSVVALVLTQIS